MKEWKGLIRRLIYYVQFDPDPLQGVDRVISQISKVRNDQPNRRDYNTAINEALASEEQLSKLIPQDHSEEVIRNYLKQVAIHLKLTNGNDI